MDCKEVDKQTVNVLVRAIGSKDYDRIDKILDSNKNSNILTDLDEVNDSAIYTSLLIGDMKCLNKILLHIKNYKMIKSKLDIESLGALATIVESPQASELTPIGIIDNYLRPLYTSDSIDELIKLIGEDVIYSYM